jgi:hypothetical protein
MKRESPKQNKKSEGRQGVAKEKKKTDTLTEEKKVTPNARVENF